MISIIARLLFDLLRALKSPQKFRTPGCSSANFLGSWHISGLKSKSYYEILTFWSIKVIQMIQFHRFLLQKLSSSSGYSFYGFWLGCGFSFPYYLIQQLQKIQNLTFDLQWSFHDHLPTTTTWFTIKFRKDENNKDEQF